VITADRPPEWIDQNDGQSIHQRDVFQNHVKKSFELPVSTDNADAQWQVYRIINQAIITSKTGHPGPVHINAPFREPLYPREGQTREYSQQVALVAADKTQKKLHTEDWERLAIQWGMANRILIAGGQYSFSNKLVSTLDNLKNHTILPVIGGATSNLHLVKGVIKHAELILGQQDSLLQTLQPDLLITFGGGFISKNLKLFLRSYAPVHHWHIQESGYPPDTFRSLTRVIATDPANFFTELIDHFPRKENSTWYHSWEQQENLAQKKLDKFLDSADYNEIHAVDQLMKSTNGFHLHLANSSPVRWVDLIGTPLEIMETSSNRGTSGIDGCSSTAVGHSLVNDRLNLLITGDMAFFYDRNAFWHQYKLPNLKIVMLNNHGGGIFRLVDGARNQPELEELFVTYQPLAAENTARDFGMKYIHCNKKEDLSAKMEDLLQPSEHAVLLEIEFSNNMREIYQELKASLKAQL
jgi:2-succinyl-5-enolpyruvyl-6-hydroxy-3-cyclohexene-1-carboxylate synthase